MLINIEYLGTDGQVYIATAEVYEHLKRPIPSLTAMHSLSLSTRSTGCFTLDTAVVIKVHA